jgi:hypothetical protein
MKEKDLEEMAQQCDRLAEFPVTSLSVVLEQVYAEHTNEGPIQYTLSARAREAFFKLLKPQENIPLSQSTPILAEDPLHCKNSKRNKQVLRLALAMHVLRRISSARTKLLAARCECLHLIKINCLAL